MIASEGVDWVEKMSEITELYSLKEAIVNKLLYLDRGSVMNSLLVVLSDQNCTFFQLKKYPQLL